MSCVGSDVTPALLGAVGRPGTRRGMLPAEGEGGPEDWCPWGVLGLPHCSEAKDGVLG